MENSRISQMRELAGAPRPGQSSPPQRILVVDDDICNRQLIAEMLNQSGYEADAAADGAAGWDALRANHYDLLITDNFMPKVTGLEMVMLLRGQNATLPVIMATGAIPTEQLRRHPGLAINAFLPKPYSVGEMLRTVKRVLREADRAAGGTRLLAYPDRTDNQVSQDGEPADAPPQGQTNPPQRILVVEDDGDMRRVNTEVLTQSGYHVDAAEDGAVAWNTLQLSRYDLVVTDNDMPNVSGLELLQKIHASGMALPVIMATGMRPQEEFTRPPWVQPAALLLKPYSFNDLRETVKNVLLMADGVLE
jgi:DNA-binding response OmpR family regulator